MNFNPLKKISLLFLSGILLFSCSSDKLDRSKAEELIKQEFKYPNVEFTRFSLELLGSNRYQPLYNQGLLRKPSGWAMAVMVTSQGASYTPNGNQPGEFASSCFFATNVREFNEITGIVFEDENESKAKIEFNVKRKSITPFGEFLDYNEVDLIDYTVEAAKYDDGWRIINQDDNVNYSPKDFEHIFGSLSHSSVDNDIKNSIEITNESGTSPCLLKDILVENGNYYILVDYTQITGEDENLDYEFRVEAMNSFVSLIEGWCKKKLVFALPLLPFGTVWEANAHCTHLQIAQADPKTEIHKRVQFLPALKKSRI